MPRIHANNKFQLEFFRMGHKTSKNEKVENHVAFPTAKTLADLPNITITHPTPIYQPDTPNPFTVPPPTPRDTHR